MEIKVDRDVKAVLEFMQERVPPSRLASVASGIAVIAPVLWGHYQSEVVTALQMLAEPLTPACPESTHSTST